MHVIYWPFVVYFALVLAVVTLMLVISYLLGERHRAKATGEPYESGITSTGSARLRFSVKFYMVAMFFVIFDVESIFIFAWAVSFREAGWAGYVEALIFIVIMAVALIYIWGTGGLDWAYGQMAENRGQRTEDR